MLVINIGIGKGDVNLVGVVNKSISPMTTPQPSPPPMISDSVVTFEEKQLFVSVIVVSRLIV